MPHGSRKIGWVLLALGASRCAGSDLAKPTEQGGAGGAGEAQAQGRRSRSGAGGIGQGGEPSNQGGAGGASEAQGQQSRSGACGSSGAADRPAQSGAGDTSEPREQAEQGGAGGTGVAGNRPAQSGAGGNTGPTELWEDGQAGAAFETKAEYLHAYAGAICGYVTRCYSFGTLSAAQCATRFAAELSQWASWSSPFVLLDPELGKRCLQTFASCAVTTGDRCDDALYGVLEEGEPCVHDVECSRDLFCDLGTGCPGTCKPTLGQGERCSERRPCESPLICNEDDSTCVRPPSEGEECVNWSQCEEPLECDGLVCVQPAGEGEPCDEEWVGCAAPLRCDLSEEGDERCHKVHYVSHGQPCGGMDLCESGLQCDGHNTSTCLLPEEIVGRDEGESCRFEGNCRPEFSCNYATEDASEMTCIARAEVGEPCKGRSGCVRGAYCSEIQGPDGPEEVGECLPVVQPGGDCGHPHAEGSSLAQVCAVGDCVDDVCVHAGVLGEPCSDAIDCGSGECKNGICYADAMPACVW